MKRGEVWTVSGGPDYAGKARPAIIVQDEAYEGIASATLCPLTSSPVGPQLRPPITPSTGNGIERPSRIMVDKITTVPKSKLGRQLGQLADDDLVRLNRALLGFLGLAR